MIYMKKVFYDLGPGVLNSEAWRKDLWDGYTIIGLEPDPVRYETLKPTYPGILLNLAVADKHGEITGIIHDTSGFIASGYPGYSKTVFVKAVTLDEIDAQYGPFDEIAIWADIEGSELKMLKGATEVLKKTNLITLECHTGPRTDEWAKSTDIFNFLYALGFKSNCEEKLITLDDSSYDITFTKQNMKTISVVTTVLCPSEAAFTVIKACMQSVRKAIDRVHGTYIIIDDNSAVGGEFFQSIADRYYRNEQTMGISVSLNKGMKSSTTDFVIKLDSDYLVPKNLFEILLNDWSDDCCFISPSYLLSDYTDTQQFLLENMPELESSVYDRPSGLAPQYLKPLSKYSWGGGILMFDKKKLEEIDYFDEGFGIGCAEDNDVIHRLLMKGYNWRWSNNVVTRHFASVASNDPASTQKWDDIRSVGVEYFTKKHGFAPREYISKAYQHFKYE